MDNTFDEAYEKYADMVFRFAVMKVSDRDIAKDITQDTFVKTWDFVAKGKRVESWRAFLMKTARNLIIDHYRRKKADSLDTMQEAGFDPEDNNPTGGGAETYAESRIAMEAIQKLDDTHRDIIWLRFVEEMGPKEIADMLDLTENVVSVRVHRGKQQLQDIMADK